MGELTSTTKARLPLSSPSLDVPAKLDAERTHRKSGEHLGAFFSVSGVTELHAELTSRDVPITKPLEQRPWGELDFYIEDPDGYILCFSEAT